MRKRVILLGEDEPLQAVVVLGPPVMTWVRNGIVQSSYSPEDGLRIFLRGLDVRVSNGELGFIEAEIVKDYAARAVDIMRSAGDWETELLDEIASRCRDDLSRHVSP